MMLRPKYTYNTHGNMLRMLNISDNEKVFVRMEGGTVRYQYDNHLGSACLELDEYGYIISYEEYHPFGTTSYRAGRSATEVSLKRYKYCGKERDEETGLYYYGARYYASWLGRFVSVDPLKDEYPTLSPYAYCANNPIKYIDPNGEGIELTFYAGKEGENTSIMLKKVVDNALDGQFETYFTKGKNGGHMLMLRATEDGGDFSKMSESSLTFYNELSKLVVDTDTIAQIDVKYGDSEVMTGNYKYNAIDIGDIMQFNVSGNSIEKNIGATQAGKLIHEFAEQYYKAKDGLSKGSDKNYDKNHNIGIRVENAVNGNTRGKERVIGRGAYEIPYYEKDGSTSKVIINENSSGIISVYQPKPRGKMRDSSIYKSSSK